VHMSVGVDAFPPQRYRWTIDEANFTNLLAVDAGHFFDLLFHLVGNAERCTAITQNHTGDAVEFTPLPVPVN
jgi:predicted dehydrogenase